MQRSCLTAVVGAPVLATANNEIFIGALVLRSDSAIYSYTKQHLHPGEDAVFAAGNGGAGVCIDETKIALAVCADFTQASHAAQAAQSNAGIYAAGVLITENGYPLDTGLLSRYAAEHNMAVLMANHGGKTGGWESVGRSAFWAEGGRLVVDAPGVGNLLVIASRDSASKWEGQIVNVSI